MIIGMKDGIKLFGIAVVSACAVFVCTFFLNYYLDASAIESTVSEAARPLYEAQMLSARLVCVITGGFLALTAVVLVVFYVGLYIENSASRLGVLKALGYSDTRLSLGFWVFGLSVFLGAALGHGMGYAFTPLVYEMMSEGLLEVEIRYHAVITLCLVILPAIVFSGISVAAARVKLNRSALSLMRGEQTKSHDYKESKKERPFLKQMRRDIPRAHKALAFFMAFAGFCYGSMLQMGWSMRELSSLTMGFIMFAIGLVLAFTAFLLAVSSLMRANARNVALMKAYGYTLRECGSAVFGGFRLFVYLGFAVGTAYQYGLLKLMVEVVFSGVEAVPDYTFDVAAFFVVLATFVVLYEATVVYDTRRLGTYSIRSFITE